MANMLQGQSTFIDSSGKVWHLALDFYAFAVAAKALDVGVDELLRAISSDIDEDTGRIIRAPHQYDIGCLLYGSLLRRHPDMTLPDAINLLAEGAQVTTAITTALEGAMPKTEPTASAEGNGDGTGTKRS